ASRLSCAVPEDAVVNPGSSNITHEPASSSFTLMFKVGLSVVTLYSVPARTLVSPLAVKSLPLRLRTTGGPAGAALPLIRPPPGAIATAAGAAAPAPGAPAPGPAPPAPAAGPPRPAAGPRPSAALRGGPPAPSTAPRPRAPRPAAFGSPPATSAAADSTESNSTAAAAN